MQRRSVKGGFTEVLSIFGAASVMYIKENLPHPRVAGKRGATKTTEGKERRGAIFS